MIKPVMGIQLYTLRDFIQTAEDFDNTLARLAGMGVTDVQISAIGDIPAETQKEILDKHGIKVCVTHKSFDRMKNDLPALLAEHKVIGCDALGLGAAPGDCRDTYAAVKPFAESLEKIGAACVKEGMTFQYHNHDFEFRTLSDCGKRMIDVLIDETDPALLHFIPDVAWIDYGGEDPVEILKRMKGRVKVLHFKDYIIDGDGARKFVSLGKGQVDLAACYRAACELEIPYIMYEQDDNWADGDAFKATEESWAFMQSLIG
ncbi:MAG: sugar phosphate isomerase/epimerase [Clostridia bacterium]|nr:sugar phosphate isomerase/epimerase [Clostridia bacterium]